MATSDKSTAKPAGLHTSTYGKADDDKGAAPRTDPVAADEAPAPPTDAAPSPTPADAPAGIPDGHTEGAGEYPGVGELSADAVAVLPTKESAGDYRPGYAPRTADGKGIGDPSVGSVSEETPRLLDGSGTAKLLADVEEHDGK